MNQNYENGRARAEAELAGKLGRFGNVEDRAPGISRRSLAQLVTEGKVKILSGPSFGGGHVVVQVAETGEKKTYKVQNDSDPLRCAECGAPLGKKPIISSDGQKAYCPVHAPKKR